MEIDKDRAAEIVREEAHLAGAGKVDASWSEKVERLSKLCADGISSTHIAFLGTTMLAKSVNRKTDLFAIKPKLDPANPNAYSARSLCHGVLVPLSAELGFSLGVTGREPLNNQPYFRMKKLGDDTPVHQRAKAAFDYMIGLVRELDSMKTEAGARQALRAFIAVRLTYQPRYTDHDEKTEVTPDQLVRVIKEFVRENSEGGRRAQGIVAGLMDVFAGPDRVESGRINDPSRHYPGDVCVRSAHTSSIFEKAIEVRDKPVSENDIHIFGKKCVDMEVREAAVLMVSGRQNQLDATALTKWADGFGIGLTLFYGWEDFVSQVLFWSADAKPIAANHALRFIHQRLLSIEVSPKAVSVWQSLTSNKV